MHAVSYDEVMAEGRTIQVRGVDPAVADALERAASAAGVSLSAYLRERLGEVVWRDAALDAWWETLPSPDGPAQTPDERQAEIDAWKAERDASGEWPR